MQKPCKCKKKCIFFVHNPHSSLCTTLISQTPRIIIDRITYSDVKFNFQLIGTIPRLLRLTVFEIQPFFERGSFLSIFMKIKKKDFCQKIGYILDTVNLSNLEMVSINLKLNFASEKNCRMTLGYIPSLPSTAFSFFCNIFS